MCIGCVHLMKVYNHRADKRLPAPVAKHTKKITSLVWSRDEKLALASEDRAISVSDANGDHICQVSSGLFFPRAP